MLKLYEKRGRKWNNEYFDNGDGGMSWHGISKYLVENDLITKAKGETIKKYYDEWTYGISI